MINLNVYYLLPKDRSKRVRWLLKELNVEFSEQRLNASLRELRLRKDYLSQGNSRKL